MATITGTVNSDLLEGGDEDDLLQGFEGNDTLDGAGGANTLEGGTGDDTYRLHALNDQATEAFGEGKDSVYWAGIGAYQLADNIEDLILIDGATEATGNALDNFISVNIDNIGARTQDLADDPSVTIDGAGGNDDMWGGANDDVMFGGDGNDHMDGAGGGDQVHGGNGDDFILGESFSFGDGWDDTLFGDAGNDTLEGLDGNDALSGGSGQDVLDGYSGNNTLNGGAGADWFQVDVGTNGSNQDVVEDFTNGDDLILLALDGLTKPDMSYVQSMLQQGSDTLITFISGATMRLVGVSADTLASEDFLFYQDGTLGSDSLSGGAFADRLVGEAGADTLASKKGTDVLIGGSGRDLLTGGRGADLFQFNALSDGWDTIADFSAQQGDMIDVSALDANIHKAGNQAFHFVGEFNGHAGQAELIHPEDSDRTILKLDTDGDSHADFKLTLIGHVGNDAGWFL